MYVPVVEQIRNLDNKTYKHPNANKISQRAESEGRRRKHSKHTWHTAIIRYLRLRSFLCLFSALENFYALSFREPDENRLFEAGRLATSY